MRGGLRGLILRLVSPFQEKEAGKLELTLDFLRHDFNFTVGVVLAAFVLCLIS